MAVCAKRLKKLIPIKLGSWCQVRESPLYVEGKDRNGPLGNVKDKLFGGFKNHLAMSSFHLSNHEIALALGHGELNSKNIVSKENTSLA